MTTEEKIVDLKGELDKLKKEVEDLKPPVIQKEIKYQDKILNANGEITSLYLGDELYPIIDTDTNTTDHGELDGLSDDDHTQYHNDTRGDARYIEKDGTTSDISADISLNTHKLTDVADPTSAQDATTKNYVDGNTLSNDDLDRVAHVEVVASDALKASADALQQTSSSSYEKLKEIKVEYHGTMRIYFEMQAPALCHAYARVYRSGTPVGTEYHEDTGGSMEHKSQDISGWEQDDLCQLYAKKDDGAWANVQNFRIYYDHQFMEDYAGYPAPTVNTN
jgi:hypothetical protein